MHYLGGGGSGEPVVIIHWATSSCHWYNPSIPHFSDSLRVITLNQRTHGKTDQPCTGYDWHTLAWDVVGALDQLVIQKAAVARPSIGQSS